MILLSTSNVTLKIIYDDMYWAEKGRPGIKILDEIVKQHSA